MRSIKFPTPPPSQHLITFTSFFSFKHRLNDHTIEQYSDHQNKLNSATFYSKKIACDLVEI